MNKIFLILFFISSYAHAFLSSPSSSVTSNITAGPLTANMGVVTDSNALLISSQNNSRILFVDSIVGNDVTDCGMFTPCQTIERALSFAVDDSKKYLIFLFPGDYGTGESISWPFNVSLLGHNPGSTFVNKVISYTGSSGEEASFSFSGITISNQMTFDLSGADQAIIYFYSGSYNIKRTDTASGAHYIAVYNSIIGEADITGTVAIYNSNFVSTLVVRDGGQLLLNGSIVGTPFDIYGTGIAQFISSILAADVTGHDVSGNTPTISSDSASLAFNPNIVGANLSLINQSRYESYAATNPSDWTEGEPTIVKDALDKLAARAGGGGAVDSVNGETGDVVLTANEIDYTPTTSSNWNSVPATTLEALDYLAGVGVFKTQTANVVFAGPTTGSPDLPTFRSLVSADIPQIDLSTSAVTGTLPATSVGANWFVSSNINTDSGQLTLQSSSTGASWTALSASGVNLVNATGSLAAEIPCASGVSSSGLFCGSGADEIAGIAFTPTKSCTAKISATFTHNIRCNTGTGRCDGDGVFNIIETDNTSNTPVTVGQSKRWSALSITQNSTNNHEVMYNITLFGTFAVTSGVKSTFKLMYQKASDNNISSNQVLTSVGNQGGTDIQFMAECIN